MVASREARQHRGPRRLHGDNPQARFALLHRLADPGDRPSGADRRNENVDLSVRVLPEFHGGGPPVHLRIGGVRKLVKHHRPGVLLKELLGAPHRGRHEDSGRQHDLRVPPPCGMVDRRAEPE
jgi:hypothetical protein